MIRIRSRYSLRFNKTGDLIIERNPFGRIVYGLVLIFLVIVSMVAIDSGQGSSVLGAVFLLLLFLFFIGGSAGNKRYHFSHREKKFEIIRSFLGLPLTRQKFSSTAITSIRIHSIEFNTHNPRTGNPGLYYLHITMSDSPSRITLEDSSDLNELQALGISLSTYLAVPLEQ